MPKYRLYPKAESDLEEIWHYTFHSWGIEQASNYIDDLDNAFQLLAHNPLICRERDELTPPVRIYHSLHHLVVYCESDIGVDIIRILHENADYETHLFEGHA